MSDPGWVEYFRSFLGSLTVEEIVTMNSERLHQCAFASWTAFMEWGDPQCWPDFDSLPIPSQALLKANYRTMLADGLLVPLEPITTGQQGH